MSTNSSIEWTETTWNPVSGCTRASAGCDNCYAVTMTHRLEAMGQAKYAGLTVVNGKGDRHFNGIVKTHDDTLAEPLRWRKPRKVFVNSMSDLFHRDIPFGFIDKVFAVMALTPQHTYQILTKRPERMAEYLTQAMRVDPPESRYPVDVCAAHRRIRRASEVIAEERSGGGCWREHYNNLWPLPNVWLGTSVENQDTADNRIAELDECPAAVRFLSCEPLLSGIDGLFAYGMNEHFYAGRIGWVIVGGESGHGARPCNVEWIRSIVNQCKAAGVPVFVKQLGSRPVSECDAWAEGPMTHEWAMKDRKGGDMAEFPADLQIREFPCGNL